VGRRRGRLRLRRELVHVVLGAAAAPEGEELRLEAVVVGLAGVAHGREKGILGGQAPLPHGRRRRRLQVLELEDGGRRRVCLVLHLLVELEQVLMVVVLLLLFICFLLRLRSSSAAASVAAVSSTPVVVPRIQIPRLLGRRYCCSGSSNARPSTSPEPITRMARNT